MNNIEIESDLTSLEDMLEELADDQTNEDALGVMVAYGSRSGGYPTACW